MNFKTSTAYALGLASAFAVATTVACMAQEIMIEMVPGSGVTPKAERCIGWHGAGDAASTAAAIASGVGVEANPVIGAAGNAAAPAVSLLVKLGICQVMKSNGASSRDIATVSKSAGMTGMVNNALIFAGGGPFAIVGGMIAGAAIVDQRMNGRSTAPQFDRIAKGGRP